VTYRRASLNRSEYRPVAPVGLWFVAAPYHQIFTATAIGSLLYQNKSPNMTPHLAQALTIAAKQLNINIEHTNSYSGRFMMGYRTNAIICHPNDLPAITAQVMAILPIPDNKLTQTRFIKELKTIKHDDLGKCDHIIY